MNQIIVLLSYREFILKKEDDITWFTSNSKICHHLWKKGEREGMVFRTLTTENNEIGSECWEIELRFRWGGTDIHSFMEEGERPREKKVSSTLIAESGLWLCSQLPIRGRTLSLLTSSSFMLWVRLHCNGSQCHREFKVGTSASHFPLSPPVLRTVHKVIRICERIDEYSDLILTECISLRRF